MTSEITLFVNPTAGRGRGAHAAQPAASALRAAGFSVRAVLPAGTRTPLGLVAVGTGNDFARALSLPVGDPAAARG